MTKIAKEQMTNTTHRDNLIITLLRGNEFRPAWPIYCVLPLITRRGMPITHNDFMALLAKANVSRITLEDAKKLTEKLYAKDETRPTRTRFEQYTGVHGWSER